MVGIGAFAMVLPRAEAEDLHALLAEDWEYTMHEFPEWATSVGYPGQSHRWTDRSKDFHVWIGVSVLRPPEADLITDTGYHRESSDRSERRGMDRDGDPVVQVQLLSPGCLYMTG